MMTKALENVHSFDRGDSTFQECVLTKYRDKEKYSYTEIRAEMFARQPVRGWG